MHNENVGFSRVIERFLLIDRYIRSELDESESAEFEIRMLDDPDLFKEVEEHDVFIRSLKSEPDLLKPRLPKLDINLLGWIKQPFSIAAITLASFLLVLNIVPLIPMGEPQAFVSGYVVQGATIIQPTRSATTSLVVSGSPPYLLQVDVGFATSEVTFDVSLVNVDSLEIAVSELGIVSDGRGWLWIVLIEEAQGTYGMQVTRHEAGSAPVTQETLIVF